MNDLAALHSFDVNGYGCLPMTPHSAESGGDDGERSVEDASQLFFVLSPIVLDFHLKFFCNLLGLTMRDRSGVRYNFKKIYVNTSIIHKSSI